MWASMCASLLTAGVVCPLCLWAYRSGLCSRLAAARRSHTWQSCWTRPAPTVRCWLRLTAGKAGACKSRLAYQTAIQNAVLLRDPFWPLHKSSTSQALGNHQAGHHGRHRRAAIGVQFLIVSCPKPWRWQSRLACSLDTALARTRRSLHFGPLPQVTGGRSGLDDCSAQVQLRHQKQNLCEIVRELCWDTHIFRGVSGGRYVSLLGIRTGTSAASMSSAIWLHLVKSRAKARHHTYIILCKSFPVCPRPATDI